MKLLFSFFFCILLSSPASVFSKKKVYTSEYKCDVCKAIVDEIEYDISKVDPSKTIQVGSFRVNPNGETRTVQKKFARSETHVSELVDDVCQKISNNYIEFDDETKTKRLKRLTTMDGKINGNIDYNKLMEDVKNGEEDPTSKGKTIKFQCNKLVEQMEDELIEYFQDDEADKPNAQTVCSEFTDHCKKPKQKTEEEKKEEL